MIAWQIESFFFVSNYTGEHNKINLYLQSLSNSSVRTYERFIIYYFDDKSRIRINNVNFALIDISVDDSCEKKIKMNRRLIMSNIS